MTDFLIMAANYLIAITLEFPVQVNTGNHTGNIITLSKYNPHMLLVLPGIAFQSIGWTGLIMKVRFPRVQVAILQNIPHFCF